MGGTSLWLSPCSEYDFGDSGGERLKGDGGGLSVRNGGCIFTVDMVKYWYSNLLVGLAFFVSGSVDLRKESPEEKVEKDNQVLSNRSVQVTLM